MTRGRATMTELCVSYREDTKKYMCMCVCVYIYIYIYIYIYTHTHTHTHKEKTSKKNRRNRKRKSFLFRTYDVNLGRDDRVRIILRSCVCP